jgi:predicted RNA-binding protein associated with RNAse of E/G family
LTPDDENATLAWLEDALEQAYAHGQMTTLAYLEAVMEDVVFVMEMVRRESFTVG